MTASDTALSIAAGNDELDCVKRLIAKGANLQTATGEGKTALEIAKEDDCTDIVLLLDGAKQDDSGKRVLDDAKQEKHTEVVLIVDPDAKRGWRSSEAGGRPRARGRPKQGCACLLL